MNANSANLSRMIMDRLADGIRKADIESELEQKGFDRFMVGKLMDECSKLHASRKRVKGLAFIAVGALICFASCIITLFFDSGIHSNYTLIGLTSVGILFIFAGLVQIF